MITINLLPIEEKEKIKIAKQNLGFLIICLSIMIVIGIIIIVLISAQYTLKILMQSTNDNIANIENELDNYSSTRNDIYFIKDRLQEINSLKSVAWSEYLKTLVKVTPENITLNDFVITAKNKPEVKIYGFANSKTDVAQFKENLESSPYFKNMIFESSKKTKVNNVELNDFTLSGELEKK